MADTFNLPRIGDAMSEGEIVEWFVAVGDEVELDQVICSVETDKSVVELTTPYRGTVLALGATVGEVLQVGDALLVVGQAGEAPPTPPAAVPPAPVSAEPVTAAVASAATPSTDWGPATSSPVVRRLADQHGVDVAALAGSGVGGRVTRADVVSATSGGTAPTTPTHDGPVRAMPKVRKFAREHEIDLTSVAGTGTAGAITTADLEAMLDAGPPAGHRERLSAMRRSIAAHLTQSAQTIPQFTSTVDVDATAVLATRQALRERLDAPVPVDAVLMALLIPVLRDHPRMNAWLDGDEIVYHGGFDIGVAVDTPDGLMVPVVARADRRTIAELASEIVRLATAARDRTIEPGALSGATCTVNNVGAVGIESGTPILPMGTSTIVAFGRTRPVVRLTNGNPVEVPTITVCATFDHRLIDGGDAGRFLTQLKQHLEVPALGLL